MTHRGEDVRDLALHAKHDDAVDLPFALEQIAGLQRAAVKLPEWAARDGLIFPPQLAMEQCSSQFTARYKARLAHRLVSGKGVPAPDGARPTTENECAAPGRGPTTLVDLTGGLGVDFSYMALQFDHAIYVERQRNLCDIARHNLPLLALGHAEVVNADSTEVLAGLEPASLVFVDPARRGNHGQRTYAIADCTPDVLALREELLAKAPLVMVKLSPMLDWHKTVADFTGSVSEVHIISTGNECKELLLVLGREHCAAPQVWCVNDDQTLEFIASDDGCDSGAAWDVDPDRRRWRFVYEPNASIMKAGCFDLIERRFGVRSLAPNSHLFVSSEPVADFPGRSFAIDAISTLGKKELRTALGGITHANIAVRNCPISVAQLRRKLKLADGGDVYLFATALRDATHVLFVTHKTDA